jgi:hypothetical protein
MVQGRFICQWLYPLPKRTYLDCATMNYACVGS